ncbi:MAG: hypothetical protein HQL69_01865 [Magnetococcales bacterium]|nr:hypothetical protein [Magnetococcales bacterium]
MTTIIPIFLALFFSSGGAAWAESKVPEQNINVGTLSAAPVVDGSFDDWPQQKSQWSLIPVKPALPNDDKNRTGELEVELIGGVFKDKIYFAVSWPDSFADVDYRPWKWRGKKYKRTRKRDDMFALRFDLGGDYDSCMLPEKPKTYSVDIWLWSAGRSNLAGVAEDKSQLISSEFIENAAEYTSSVGGMVYIKKKSDPGDPVYKVSRPKRKKFKGKILSGVDLKGEGSGGLVDVSAKGIWKDGRWFVEFSRKLNTDSSDDVIFPSKGNVIGAIAVFNKGWAEHKSVSGDLRFVFSE